MKNLIIRFDKKNFIKEIMQQCFLSTNFYILRIEYSMNEYKNQRIPWKDRIFKRTVWITAICWVNLLFWIAIIKWPNDIFPLTFNDIDQMTAIHGSNLFSFASIFTFSTLEYVWFSTFFPLLLNYDLRANDLLIKYGKFSHYHLSKNVGQKFYKLVTISNIINSLFGLFVISFLTMYFIILIIILIKFFLHKNICLIRLIISLQLLFILYCRMLYTFGQGLISFRFLIIIIELFLLQFKELSSKFKHIFRHRNQQKLFINNGRLYFRYFQRKYIVLYNEISKTNQTFRIYLFAIEILSKLSIIICILFYYQQTVLNIYNISFIISLITMFCTTTAIYSRLSNLPLYNQQCCNFLFEWNARIQSICSIAMIKRKIKRYYLLHERQTIKINLFIQTMTDNRFGFTCGQIFFITKYKYSELIMLSIVLILLFYKKIFLNLDLKS